MLEAVESGEKWPQNKRAAGHTISRRMMEIVTQWTARRTYPQFLEGLGGKARHQEAIKVRGYGYGKYIRNFDRLREALGIAMTERCLPVLKK